MGSIVTFHLAAIVGHACKRKIEEIKCCRSFIYGEKICQHRHQRREDKLYMCSDTLNGKNFWKICVTLQCHRPFHFINGQF